MRSTRDCLCGQRWTKALRAAALLSLALYSSLAFAQANVNGFTGDFATNYWTATPDAGSIYFTNANTELVLSGPPNESSPTLSTEPILYNGPLSGGLTVGGTIQFNWQYYSPYGGGDEADFLYTPAGGSSTSVNLAQGAGTLGDIYAIQLGEGATFKIVLINDNPGKPLPALLMVTNFQFRSNVPEPSTGALFASFAVVLTAVSFWRSRRHSH